MSLPTAHSQPWSRPNYGARTPRRPVSLRNRSVVRPQPCPWAQAFGHALRSANALPFGVSPGKPHVGGLAASAPPLPPPKRPCSIPRVRSSFGVGSGTARRYLQSLSTNSSGRSTYSLHLLHASWFGTAVIPIQAYYTPLLDRLPWRLFLNSSLCLPTAYHSSLGTTPTCARHDH